MVGEGRGEEILTNARRVLRPIPLVAPTKTAVRDLEVGEVEKRLFEARIAWMETMFDNRIKEGRISRDLDGMDPR